MSTYIVKPFDVGFEEQWDDFVINHSVNGTFLQTRNFLNYHPVGKFKDASSMIYHKNRLIAVVPACDYNDNGKKWAYSHKGSTYGGIIIKKDYYTAERVIEIVDCIEDYYKNGFSGITYKITSDIHSSERSDLLQYVLWHRGYRCYNELNTYIDLKRLDDDVISTFDRNKIRNIKKCEEKGLVFLELLEDKQVEEFYNLLTINLSKYNLNPVHSLNEILMFKNERIPNNVKFYGVFRDNIMMAGGMMFVFNQANVIHAQNLSADYRFTEYSPITYLYYKVIQKAKEDGYKAISWGISTENKGSILNMGLIRNKESYGSIHQLNRTFFKEF